MKTPHHSARFGRRLALSGACTLVLSGCFGSFGAVRALWDWNDDVSSSKWVDWLVFLGLSIIPVYELFVLADVLVLNSVEFWTGSNPVKNAEGGRSVTRVATADPNTLKLEVRRAGRLEYVAFCRRGADGSVQLLDASGKPLSTVSQQNDGGLQLRGGDQSLLAQLDRAALERVVARVKQGQPVHAMLQRELGENSWQMARLGNESALPSQLF
jgi:hypothetical protein